MAQPRGATDEDAAERDKLQAMHQDVRRDVNRARNEVNKAGAIIGYR